MAELEHRRRLAAFEFGAPQQAHDPLGQGGIDAAPDQIFGALMLFQKRLQQRIEQRVIRQRVAVALVGSQFSAGGFLTDGCAHQFTRCRQAELGAALRRCRGIDPGAEAEHAGFVEVANHGQPAVHVAIEGAVTNRELTFVAGGEQQLPLLVGHGHQQGAADARLQVFGS